MSIGQAVAVLLAVATVVLVGIEVVREVRGPEWLAGKSWGPALSGALTMTVVLLLVATLSLLHAQSK